MIPLIATAAFAFALAAPTESDTRSRTVHHADLDLRTPADVLRLQRRIERAARWVCRVPSPTNPILWRFERECVAAALLEVQPQVASVVRSARRVQVADMGPPRAR